MASGWHYLLPDSDSDDGDNDPITLPDGRLACYRHFNIICYQCCVDYSFMEPNSDYEEEEDDDVVESQEAQQESYRAQGPESFLSGLMFEDTSNTTELPIISSSVVDDSPESWNKVRRGTGRIFPTKFTLPSPSFTPSSVFQGQATYAEITRFIHRQDPQKFLILTDGACINNGQLNPKAGWAFVQGPRAQGDLGNSTTRTVAGRLENKGPFDDEVSQTSNRAEMRAIIAALRFRHWPGEGFRVMVIATDSEYVVEGATGWVKGWIRNGWKTRTDDAVKNKDLWECMLGEVERHNDSGMKVEFWRIPRELNSDADAAAKAAAEEDETDKFMDIFGICF